MSVGEMTHGSFCEHAWKRRRGYWECVKCGRNETDDYRALVGALGLEPETYVERL